MWIKICLLFVGMASTGAIQAQMRISLQEEIEKIIHYDTEISPDKVPGYTIGVIVEDSTFIFHYGTASKKNPHTLFDTTSFELGGLTKVFTASLIEVLVERNLMHYDSSFNSYLPSSLQNPRLAQLRLEQLVLHTSGLPKMPFEFGAKEKEINNPYAHYTEKDLMSFYQQYYPVEEEQQNKYFYSNLNYALLGVAIENATGQSYEAALSQYLLEPLGMDQVYCHGKDQLTSSGYTIDGRLTPPWRFQSFEASEGLKASVKDLLTFLAVNIGQQEPSFSQAFAALQVPQVKTDMNKYALAGRGWHVVKTRRYYNSILHSGATSGHRAFMGFVKESQTAVVVLSNSEHSTNGLGFLILRMINNNWKKRRR